MRTILTFDCTAIGLKEKILKNKPNKFQIEWFSKNEFRVRANVTFSFLNMPSPIGGITLDVKLKDNTNNTSVAEIEKIHKSKFLFILVFVLIIVILNLTKVLDFPWWISAIVALLVIMNSISVKTQEQSLKEKTKKYLRSL